MAIEGKIDCALLILMIQRAFSFMLILLINNKVVVNLKKSRYD